MKKSFYAMTIAMMSLASCSLQEDLTMAEAEEFTPVTISAALPIQTPTRLSIDEKNMPGQGNKIAKMEYAIFDKYGILITHSGKSGAPQAQRSSDDHGRYDLKVTLLKNHTYTFYLWASADDESKGVKSPYTFHPGRGTGEAGALNDKPYVTIDYSKVRVNDETMDAFFGKHTYKIADKQNSDEDYMVTLNRPFNQLNILLNDTEKAKELGKSYKLQNVTITVNQAPGRYSRLDLETLKASDPVDQVAFSADFEHGISDLVHAGDGDVAHYYYLATCYMLTGITPDGTLKGKVGTAKELTDLNITFTYTDNSHIVLNKTNVPIRRNWRTDIYGALQTTEIDVNCRIDFEFQDKYQDGPGATTGTGSDDGDHSNDNNDTQEDL